MSEHHPATHGQVEYLQIPARDIAASAAFYGAVFGWSVTPGSPSFEAQGLIGQWSADREPVAGTQGPLLWIAVDSLWHTLQRVAPNGGKVLGRPRMDGGRRWLAEIQDPAGNRVGVVVHPRPVQSQTLIAVRDVEASSRWYQHLLGLKSDHGGPHYERLVAGDTLVLQLHNWDVEHDHGAIGAPDREVGNGVLLWFGEVADFDGAVARANDLGAPIVLAPRKNGPDHREIWIKDPDGYTVVIASTDGEAFEPSDG